MALISRIVRKHDLALIADEVYREFVYDGEYKSFGTMPELAEHLIMIDSVSKRYSACGDWLRDDQEQGTQCPAP